MKTIAKFGILFLLGMVATDTFGQKKVRHFVIEREFNLPADEVWKVVASTYGDVSQSHPYIYSSEYINGTTHACDGAERVCHFSEDGSKYLKETMLNLDEENRTFTNKITEAGKFPVDPEYTQAVYKVEDLGNGRSKLSFDMQYRTKPALMGWMAQGKFKKIITDYLLGIEYFIGTGEEPSPDNIKDIRAQYE